MEIEDQKQEAEESGPETAVVEELPLAAPGDDAGLKAAIEAIVYVCEEPATAAQIANALQRPQERVVELLAELVAEYAEPGRGLMIRELAGGYKMATKPEHHEAVRAFAKSLKPALKLSLPALETLATIAYKQPITAPEIMEIRGVQGAGVLKTLLDRKLIQTAGRKNVVGRPILYRTSKEFLLQFGLKDVSELPTLKEFEELRRLAVGDEAEAAQQPEAARNGQEAGAEAEAGPGAPEASTEAGETEEPEAASPGMEGAPQDRDDAGLEPEASPEPHGESPDPGTAAEPPPVTAGGIACPPSDAASQEPGTEGDPLPVAADGIACPASESEGQEPETASPEAEAATKETEGENG
jgi:segregation and condensation protein B